MSFKLVIEDDEGNKTIVPVIRDEISIGRQEGNTIRLTERNVSRQHGKLVRDNGAVYFEEVSARYGTWINGEKVTERTKFDIGDVVSVGDYRLTLQPEASQSVDVPVAKEVGEEVTKPDLPRATSDGTEIMPIKPARLIIVSSNFAGQEFPLDRKEMIIGRGEECDIIIDHRSVSTTHAKIVREPKGVYKIIDLNSKNGVKVSGEEYKAIHLKRGDVIELGHVRFRFVEPGENYVFSPHTAFEDFEPDTRQGSPALLIGGIFAVICIVAVLAVILMPPSEKPGDGAEKEDPVAMVNSKELPESNFNEKVDSIVKDSRDHIKQGEIDKAIAKLDTAKDLDPTPEQAVEIDRMLSDAAAWAPLARSFAMGRDYFDEGEFADALSKFKEVAADKSTPIYALMQKQNYPDKTITALLGEARKAMGVGEKEKALDAIEEILLYDSENEAAVLLKEEMGKSATVVAVNNATEKPFEKKVKPKEKVEKKKVVKPEIDLTKGKEIHDQAFKDLISGQFGAAIKKCKEGVKKYKYKKCHNVIATSYLKLDQTENACRHFAKVGKKPPECE